MTAQPFADQPTTVIPTWGAAQPGYALGGYYGGPPAPQPPKRNVAKIVGLVSGVVVALAALASAALFLLGPKTVDPQSVQQEIVRITQSAVGVVPADVRCPDTIKAQAGGVFTCTATVDGQPETYTVHQDDAKGHLTITYDRLIKTADVQNAMVAQVGKDVGVDVTVSCGPRTVVVSRPGTPIACTVTNAGDSTDSAGINVTVDANGMPSYKWA